MSSQARRYRRRAPSIEAIHYTPGDADEVADWCGGRLEVRRVDGLDVPHILVDGSIHAAKPGDYIIKGESGRYFPMPPAMFEHSYEPAES